MADAFRFYRDDLGWQVYPVDGVWSSKPDPGKKPSIKEWWNYDPHDCDVAKYFGNNGHCHNIGFAPRSSVVVVDLDSKADQGESVWHFLSDTPALEKVPRHRTHGGVHLLFWCPDLPRWKKRNGCLYHDTLNSQINKKVSAELFHSDHSNVVFPPSVHPSGGVYKWETFGEIPAATWKRLQKTFGFRPPEDRAGKKEESEEKWHLKYEGDLSSLDLIALLEELGWPATLCGADEGKYSISCPWETEHMAKTKVAGTSTVVWPAGGDAGPQFRCLHSHCAPRGIKDLLAWAKRSRPASWTSIVRGCESGSPGRLKRTAG